MSIRVNGEEQAWVADLQALLHRLALDQATVATALNGEFVPARKRAEARLHEGDQIEILAPMQGG